MKTPTRFAELRRARGLTQQQVANAVGVSTVTVYRWERSELKPKAYILPALAGLLGTTVDYLLGETDNPTPAGGGGGIMQTATNANGNITQTNQSVNGDVHGNTMTVGGQSPATDSPSAWWPDVLAKAYEMERTGDPRAAEAAVTVRMAADVLKRASEKFFPA